MAKNKRPGNSKQEASGADADDKALVGDVIDTGITVSDEGKSLLQELILRFAFGEKTAAQKGRLYPNAFEIDEETIKRIDTKVRERFSALSTWPVGNVDFKAEAGFPDLSTAKFDSLPDLLREAGQQQNPESLTLEWKALLQDPPAMLAAVTMEFVTEAPLAIEELGLLEYKKATMELQVSGSTEDWVDKTYRDLTPYFDAAKISGLYKPLLIFRNLQIVLMFSFVTATIGQFVASDTLYNLSKGSTVEQRFQERMNRILDQPTLEGKFDQFIRDRFEIQATSSQELTIFAASALAFIAILVVSYFLYPKLVPRSFIAIGLARKRIEKYQNVVRFLIFDFLITGVIAGIVATFFLR